jgi:L-fuconolactonase
MWELDRPGRPWPAGRFVPKWASKAFSRDDLIGEMDRAGVDRAVIVPPAFEGDRNDLCLAAAQAHPERLAVMGRLPLDDPGSRPLLNRWKENRGALGLRFTFSIPQQLSGLPMELPIGSGRRQNERGSR